MSKNIYIGGFFSLFLALAGVLYFAFIVPRIVRGSGEQPGNSYSAFQQAVGKLSEPAMHYGLILIAVLLLGIIGCAIGAVIADNNESND